MKDQIDTLCAWNAGHVINDLYKELGMERTYYLDTLAKCFGLDTERGAGVDTIVNWRRETRGLPAQYTHKRVMAALDAVIESYKESLPKDMWKADPILARWRERRERTSSYLKSMIGRLSSQPPSENFAEKIAAIFETLTTETAFTLYSCFDALNFVSRNDLNFLDVLLKTPKGKLVQKVGILTQRQIAAQSLLDCLHNAKVTQWLELLNEHHTTRTKEDIWERLLETADECGCNAMMWAFLLDILIDKSTGTFIDKTRFGQAEIDLLILFKFCLTADEQIGVLTHLRGQV